MHLALLLDLAYDRLSGINFYDNGNLLLPFHYDIRIYPDHHHVKKQYSQIEILIKLIKLNNVSSLNPPLCWNWLHQPVPPFAMDNILEYYCKKQNIFVTIGCN